MALTEPLSISLEPAQGLMKTSIEGSRTLGITSQHLFLKLHLRDYFARHLGNRSFKFFEVLPKVQDGLAPISSQPEWVALLINEPDLARTSALKLNPWTQHKALSFNSFSIFSFWFLRIFVAIDFYHFRPFINFSCYILNLHVSFCNCADFCSFLSKPRQKFASYFCVILSL